MTLSLLLAMALSLHTYRVGLLFTPGQDEAINPLILGLSAAILILLSKITDFNFNTALGISLLIVVLAGLFLFSKTFVNGKDKTDTNKSKDIGVPQQIPQATEVTKTNPLNITGSFEITSSNQRQ